MEFPREFDTGKYCSDFVHFFGFIAVTMKISKYIDNHLFSKVKCQTNDK